MKIIVYAIAKNEEQFVNRWCQSMKEADDIYVLDTGSTDNTVKLLQNNGVHVTEETIHPWRFDTARNISLALVPTDVDLCVCTDLDEVFETGWRKKLEQEWNHQANRISYSYHWQLDENNKPIISFYISKIHTRQNYCWTHPVHEVLTYLGNHEQTQIIDDIQVYHYPDTNKSRSSYLPLLELSVQEDPSDDRNMHYLGREYMYYGYNDKAIDTLKKHLKLKKATWKDERCASMRFIARCYAREGKYQEAIEWVKNAIEEAPYLRDPYMEKAMIDYQQQNWQEVIHSSLQALTIVKNQKTYINESFCQNEVIYDLLSIAFYNLELYSFSDFCIQEALKFSPNNTRLIENQKIIQSKSRKGNV